MLAHHHKHISVKLEAKRKCCWIYRCCLFCTGCNVLNRYMRFDIVSGSINKYYTLFWQTETLKSQDAFKVSEVTLSTYHYVVVNMPMSNYIQKIPATGTLRLTVCFVTTTIMFIFPSARINNLLSHTVCCLIISPQINAKHLDRSSPLTNVIADFCE